MTLRAHAGDAECDDTEKTLREVLKEVEVRGLPEFKPREISQIVHALAFLGRQGGQGTAAVEARLVVAFELLILERGLGGAYCIDSLSVYSLHAAFIEP